MFVDQEGKASALRIRGIIVNIWEFNFLIPVEQELILEKSLGSCYCSAEGFKFGEKMVILICNMEAIFCCFLHFSFQGGPVQCKGRCQLCSEVAGVVFHLCDIGKFANCLCLSFLSYKYK